MPVEKSSDGTMRKVLQGFDSYSEHSKHINDTDKAFLQAIMDSPVILSLAKAHETLESGQFSCTTNAASDLVKQILRDIKLIEDVQVQELYHLLQNPNMLNVMAAHDIIAKQHFFPLQYVNEPTEAIDPEEYAVRMIGLHKRSGESLGLTVSIQNEEVVVSRILHDGLVHKQGLLHVGDIIKEINGQEIKGNLDVLKNSLSKSNDSYTFKIIPSYKEHCTHGNVFVKCNFAFDPAHDSYIPSKEAGLSFKRNDILSIVNRDDMQWWQAQQVNENGEPHGRAGLIPSSELEERRRILNSHVSNKSSISMKKEVCKMYRLSDYYNEYTDDYLLYEEVALLPPFVRKCIILLSHDSSVSNQVKSKLVETFPEYYKAPVTHTTCGTKKEHYEFVNKETMMQDIKENKYFEFTEIKGDLFGTRYDSVQNVMKSVKSCVKDVALKNVKFLLTSEFMPYIIFLKPESDIVECSAHCINLTLTHHSIKESCSRIHLNMRELSKKPQWVPVNWLY